MREWEGILPHAMVEDNLEGLEKGLLLAAQISVIPIKEFRINELGCDQGHYLSPSAHTGVEEVLK